MPQLSRDNHFVHQAYLKQWSPDGRRVWTYRTLVPREKVPVWALRPIRGIASHRDLYTTVNEGEESDEFEHWLDAGFETPAQEALAKVRRDAPLTPNDWSRLARLMAAQDVRTPTTYRELMAYWEREMPPLLDETLAESVRLLEQAGDDARTVARVTPDPGTFEDVISITVTPPADPASDTGTIRAEVVLGRRFWLEAQRHLLQETARVLQQHKWSLAEPGPGTSWFTSDHPVLRVNYYKEGNYDLKGGWGKPGGNLIVALSPRHLMFTQIGEAAPDRFAFSAEKTLEIQRMLAQRADQWIFAGEPMPLVPRLRPRHVDAAAVRAEAQAWRAWPAAQNAAEARDS